MIVKIKKLNDRAVVPYKKHDDDFCFDLVATSCEEIAPRVFKYGFGIALQIVPESYINSRRFAIGFTIRPRSSVWRTGMVLSNSIATIDEGYTGEISAVFYHVLPTMPKYEIGDRIAQIHFDASMKEITFCMTEELSKTDRGEGGYGSTGK